MTTLMIVEPESTGHRMILYVRLIVAEAFVRGWQVVLLTTAVGKAHPACKAIMAEFGERLKVALMPDIPPGGSSGAGLLRAQLSSIRAFQAGYRAVVRHEHVDFVYVPFFNNIDKLIGLYRSPFDGTPFGGMLVSAKFHHRKCRIAEHGGRQDKINEWLFRLALRGPSLALLTSIDEPLADFVRKNVGRRARKFRYVPDVSSIRQPGRRTDARATYGFAEADFVVASYGSLSPRKGLAKLLSMFAAPDLPASFRLLLVGAQNAEAKRMIAEFLAGQPQREGKVTIVDRFVSDAEEGNVFACADVMWLCYENFTGMSGVLIQSAQAGVPVVTGSYGLIERNRAKHVLGIRWSDFTTLEDSGVRFHWSRLTESIASLRGTASLRAFAEAHTPEAFGRNVIDAIAAVQLEYSAAERLLVS
jgi:glycosyltransferase involved in cell wall biosynthesis